jgi:hypothetical protein
MFSIVLILFYLPDWRRDPFQSEAETVVAGDLELRQWQADGRTGLALGGATHEEKAVLDVRVMRGPSDGAFVEFQVGEASPKAVPIRGGKATYTADALPKATSSGMSPTVQWRARLVGTSGEELSPWTKPLGFEVHKGVTLLAARGLSGRYLFAFEVVSVLLLAALVGAAFLARKEVKEA